MGQMVTLGSGRGEGHVAKVRSDGAVQTHVGNQVEVDVQNTKLDVDVKNVVEVKQAAGSGVTRTSATVGTTSATLIGSNSSRRALQIQNLDATDDVHIRFGTAAATTDDIRIGPGETYELPAACAFTGAVTAIASAGTPNVIAIQYERA